jgi:polyisoprenoid-binding protein YceI
VSLPAGTHQLGPDNATLFVRTRRVGAAAKAGHDLLIRVTAWNATLVVGEEPTDSRIELHVDAGSLRVVEGTGGLQPLGEDDIASIHKTIDDEVLKRQEIEFHSTRVERTADGGGLTVEGELTIGDRTNPISFELDIAEDRALGASAVVTQSAWELKPYSALFGALKVHDDVEVALEGHL